MSRHLAAYSITLSALATNPAGISRPSSFAALRLMTSSQWVGFLKIRHLCWVTAVENFNDLRRKASIRRFMVEGVRHQRTALDRICVSAHSGKMILLCKSPQQVTIIVILERIADHHSVDVISLHCLKSSFVLSFINWSLQGL
jgi:hypothetical protein